MPRWSRYVLGTFLVLLMVTGVLGVYTGLLGTNFRSIDAAKCYRSGQLSGSVLEEHIRKEKLRCVLNLRGDSRAKWYADEKKVCEKSNVELVSIEVSLGKLSDPKELLTLAERIEKGPYPMLMHCKNGSDRSGLGSVFYQMIAQKKNLDEALATQLNWHFGHIIVGNGACIDEFFELYRKTADGRDLKTWLKDAYPALYKERVASSKIEKGVDDSQK